MVRTSAPSSCHTKTVQDFTALPFMCTTQAPHCEVSQPTWVPVRRRFSRRYCTSRVRGSTSAVAGFPLTVIGTAGVRGPPLFCPEALFFSPGGGGGGPPARKLAPC